MTMNPFAFQVFVGPNQTLYRYNSITGDTWMLNSGSWVLIEEDNE